MTYDDVIDYLTSNLKFEIPGTLNNRSLNIPETSKFRISSVNKNSEIHNGVITHLRLIRNTPISDTVTPLLVCYFH